MLAAARPAPRAPRPPAAPCGGLRPFARATARDRRLGRRLAAGLTPAQLAHAEGVAEAEITALLAETDLAQLAEDYRALAELPEPEARERLLELARQLLEDAVTAGDVQIAFFILREEYRGRGPARRLVDGLLAAQRRAARPPAEPPPAAPPPAAPPAAAGPRASRPATHPADLTAGRAAARMREVLAREHAVLRRAMTPAALETTATPPAAAAPAAAPAPPSLNRHQRRRLAALRCRKATPTTQPPRADRPAPRSRGP